MKKDNTWSNSKYEGETKDGWYHGKGKFTFPNGVIYEGEFFKGQFHGEGTLTYPDGVRLFFDFFLFLFKNMQFALEGEI